MHKSVALISAALLALSVAALASAKTETVTGKLVDLSCFGVNHEQTGNAHKGKGLICGQACAREGFPVGLLTADGKVYQVTGALAAHANAKLVPHIAQTVTITGDIGDQDGMPTISAGELK